MRLDLDDERFIHHITKQHNRFPVLLWVIFYKCCTFTKGYYFIILQQQKNTSYGAHSQKNIQLKA